MTATFADAPEALDDLAPSAKLIWHVLANADAEELTQRQLVTRVPVYPTTVRYSLRDLEAADCIASRPCVTDARQRHYRALTR